MDVYIYGLIDPRTDEVRYIGKTINIKNRIIRHMEDVKYNTGKKSHKISQLKSLYKLNLEPEIFIIDVVNEEEQDVQEQYYIECFKSSGHNLTNMTAGGEGIILRGIDHPNYGKHHSLDTRSKISQRAKERQSNGEYDKCFKIPFEEKWGDKSEEIREKIRIGNQNKIISEETRKKQSEWQSIPIIVLNEDGSIYAEFSNSQDAANHFGCSKANINQRRRNGGKIRNKFFVVFKSDYKKVDTV